MTVETRSFGTLLRDYRVAAGISQEALAERARLSVETIGALERGVRRSPYGDTVARLADALSLAEEKRRALEDASARARARRRDVATSSPAAKRQPHNIPYPTTRLVGRGEAVSAVGELLAQARLVTLTGPPGVGKTRLALAIAAEVLESFADGAWLAELTAVATSDLVPAAVGAVFHARDQSGQGREQAIARYLRRKQVLLVLDNCEHVLPGCAQLVNLLLQACPEVRVLATSREPLRVAGEQRWRVSSLSLPADDTDRELARSDSATLFLERAVRVDPEFAVRPGDTGAIATICRRLDGIPLALELAAARTGTMPVARIARALDDRFRLLTHGDRTALHHHQTLEALFAWSYDLLSQDEQALFRRLGIFTGSWTLELAQRICAAERHAEQDVLDLLQSLIDKSLVVADVGRAAPYRLLESTREYARGRLVERGEFGELTRLHAEALRDAALRAHEEWHTANDDAALRPLVATIDDVRAALAWTFSPSGDRRVGAELIAELMQAWILIGCVAEGLGWVYRALETSAAARVPFHDETVARLHLAAGLLNLHLTRPETAIEHGERALAYFRSSGDRHRAVEALDYLCRALRHAGRPAEALQVVAEGSALAHALRLPRQSAHFVCWRAGAETGLGRFDDARRHLEDAATLFRGLGYPRGVRFVWYNVAQVEFEAGNFDRAIEAGGLAIAERRAAGIEGRWSLPQVLAYRAAAYLAVDALEAARTDAVEAIEHAREMSEMTTLGIAVEQLALVSALRGNLRLAAQLTGYGQGVLPPNYRRLYTEQTSYDRLVALLEDLAPDEREHVMEQGRELTEEALLALAFSA